MNGLESYQQSWGTDYFCPMIRNGEMTHRFLSDTLSLGIIWYVMHWNVSHFPLCTYIYLKAVSSSQHIIRIAVGKRRLKQGTAWGQALQMAANMAEVVVILALLRAGRFKVWNKYFCSQRLKAPHFALLFPLWANQPLGMLGRSIKWVLAATAHGAHSFSSLG